MYFFSVGAIFRNESHCIKEWIEHYINEGADHFYLIDDYSTDNSVELIKPYIERGLITLYTSDEPPPHVLGFQWKTYNKYILPHLDRKETKWILMCDLDEFVWSPKFKQLKEFLSEYVWNLAQVQVQPTLFGWNNLDKQPKSLVQGFTKRSASLPTKCGTYKYFVNSDYKFKSLNIHSAKSENPEHETIKYYMLIDSAFLRLNHYICQSKEFWFEVKCKRGDADGYLQRNEELFISYNEQANDVEDLELAEKNKDLNY